MAKLKPTSKAKYHVCGVPSASLRYILHYHADDGPISYTYVYIVCRATRYVCHSHGYVRIYIYILHSMILYIHYLVVSRCIAFIGRTLQIFPKAANFHSRSMRCTCVTQLSALLGRTFMLLYGACTHVCQIGNGVGAAKQANKFVHTWRTHVAGRWTADVAGLRTIVVPYGVSSRARLLDADNGPAYALPY